MNKAANLPPPQPQFTEKEAIMANINSVTIGAHNILNKCDPKEKSDRRIAAECLQAIAIAALASATLFGKQEAIVVRGSLREPT